MGVKKQVKYPNCLVCGEKNPPWRRNTCGRNRCKEIYDDAKKRVMRLKNTSYEQIPDFIKESMFKQ